MPEREREIVSRELLNLVVRASSSEEREHILAQLRTSFSLEDPQLVTALSKKANLLYQETNKLKAGISELKEIQDKQGEMIEKLTGPALHPATFQGLIESDDVTLAMVSHGPSFRAVQLIPELDSLSLERGDQVLLSEKLNIILHKTPSALPQGTDIAQYHSTLPDGQLVLESHEQQLLVHPAASLASTTFQKTDQITYDRNSRMAFAVVPQPDSDHMFMQEKPKNSWSNIGGLTQTKAKLQNAAFLIRDHHNLAAEYGVRQIRGMILYGPPGNGKTMSLQAFARDLGISLVMYLRPGDLNHKYFGESEKMVRKIFRELRRKAKQNPGQFVLLGIEEIDAICSVRGKFGSHVSDKVLGSILAEIDGMTERGNILIAGTTNRLEDLDPAITRPGRLGDCIINVSRPNRPDARQILSLHLDNITRYADLGTTPDENRNLIIEAILDRIFAPNGLGPIANLKFQDNSQHQVMPRELISGAILAKIKADASEKACLRHIAGGAQGVQLEDFLTALDEEMHRMAKALSPENCQSYLEDLPQDNRVVAVNPIIHKSIQTYQILRSA